MSKYLFFIILGVILFLYINSIEGLNVGDICVPLTPQEEESNRVNKEIRGGAIYDSCLFMENSRSFDQDSICYEDSYGSISNNCECVDVRGQNICQLKLEPGLEPVPEPESDVCAVGPDQSGLIIERLLNTGVYSNVSSRLENMTDLCRYEDLGMNDTIIQSECWSYCNNNDVEEGVCLKNPDNASYTLPTLKCDYNTQYNQDSDPNHYSQNGYEKIKALVDVNVPNGIFQQYLNLLNENNTNIFDNKNMMVNNLSFSEFLLKQYIEKKESKKLKMIARGIFYCNGKLFYFHTVNAVTRVVLPPNVIDQDKIDFYLNDNNNRRTLNRYNFAFTKELNSTPVIHVDFPTEPLSQSKSDLTDAKYNELMSSELGSSDNIDENTCQKAIKYSSGEILLTNVASDNYYSIFGENLVTFATARSREVELGGDQYLGSLTLDRPTFVSNVDMELNFVRNPNTEVFNLWLLLVRPKNNKTLGFFRTPLDRGRLATLKTRTMIDGNENKMSTYDIVGSMSPYIDPTTNTAYSFYMDEGDAFRFDGNFTPHFGNNPDKSIRISVDTRYPYLESGFDLNAVFKISDDGTTLDVINVDDVPDELPPYLPLTIYKYFQDQFVIIRDIYNQLSERRQITMDIFINVLHNITFEDYMNDRDNSIRRFLNDLY